MISHINNLDHSVIYADSVNIKKHSDTALKYINKRILDESVYYKDLIVNLDQIKKLD